jgi:phospho-N-acetylmuramoyl-pentapeptide-transferase
MGDTGSIALGGILATLAVLLKLEVLFVIVGGVFIAETASSFIQEKIGVGLIGRRIFYRAPLHHNYEHGGLAETKVVIRFWIVSGILALLALASIKLR